MSDLPPPPPPSGSSGDDLPPGPPLGPPSRPPTDPSGAPSAGAHASPWAVPGEGPPTAFGGPPETGPPEGSGDRRRTVLVVAGIVGVLVLLVATVAFVGRGDDTMATDRVSTTTTPGDASTSLPGSSSTTDPAAAPPVSEEEFLALVDELEAYVAEARGLAFEDDVTVELADDDDFEARLLEDFEDDIDEIEDAEVFYRALGLLDADRSLLDTLRDIYAAGVVGFYDPETNELVVRGRSTTPYVQQTIVHELVHALDDQHFELHRPQYDDAKDEIGTGFSAVVEGNARRIENRWLSDQPADVRTEAKAEEEAFGAGIDVSGFPEILLFQIAAPYQLGELFVGQRITSGGERAIDAALVDPPETSEQVIFPELYAERQPRIEVPVPPADGEVVDDGVVGALFLLGLLSASDSAVNQQDAFRAVQGWGGDWAVTWTEGDLACVRADFVGDTPQDTDELESALARWAEDHDGASVRRVDERARLESCGGAAGAAPPQV